jgi:hypothetical protein
MRTWLTEKQKPWLFRLKFICEYCSSFVWKILPIILIKGNAKSFRLKSIRSLLQLFICLMPPPFLGFRGGRIKLKKQMPRNISWSKFNEKLRNASSVWTEMRRILYWPLQGNCCRGGQGWNGPAHHTGVH